MNKKQIIKYFQENELDFQSASAPVWFCDLVYDAYANSQKVVKNNLDKMFCYVCLKNLDTPDEVSIHNQIALKKSFAEIEERIYTEYLKDKKSIDKRMSRHKDIQKKTDNLWKEYVKFGKKYSDKELLKVFNSLMNLQREWWYYGVIGENHGDIITSLLMPKFADRHKLDAMKANELFSILTHPKKQTILNEERKRFLDVCLEYLKDKNSDTVKNKIKKYFKDYYWFKSNFYTPVKVTAESVTGEVEAFTIKNNEDAIKKELREIDENFQHIEKKKQEIIKEFKVGKDDLRDINFAQKLIEWMDERKFGMSKGVYFMLTFAEDLARRRNVKKSDIVVCTVNEIAEFIKSEKLPTKKEMEARKNGVMFMWQRGKKFKLFKGADAREMSVASQKVKTSEIKGQVASTGGLKKVSGIVRIINEPMKEQFNEGEILVTSMTRIEFVPYMRKAKAIITNEGGIACHAAIVSRELRTPCIIGTKNATKVLKTGDAVEMDLENGLIIIIEKH